MGDGFLDWKESGKGKDSARPGEAGRWRILPGAEFSLPLPFLYPERGDVSSFLVELGDKAYEHSPEKLGRESIYNARCSVLPFVYPKAEEAMLFL
jgi:hypothetical protein